MKRTFSRRDFLKTGVGAGAAVLIGGGKRPIGLPSPSVPQTAGVMRVIASGNGIRATERAMELMLKGTDPLDSVIAGVNIVEDDPNDMSVGYGGLPNEEGEVELDASVMNGPNHASGAVAALKFVKNPSRVAKLVMERTNHCLLVGEGALKFALARGFKKENLLTDRAREAWLRWKENLSDKDNWLPPKSEAAARHPGSDHDLWHDQLSGHRREGKFSRSDYDQRAVLETARPGRRFADYRGWPLCRQRGRRRRLDRIGRGQYPQLREFSGRRLYGPRPVPRTSLLENAGADRPDGKTPASSGESGRAAQFRVELLRR